MPTLANSENPYATLNVNIEVEEELSKHAYVAKIQNPWAAIEVFGEFDPAKEEETVVAVSASKNQLELPCIPPKASLSKVEFQSRARKILLPYEPMRGGRRVLRPEFRAFIKSNEDKSSQSRAGILEELERFDLSSMGAVNPHLNREGSALVRKLEKISAKFPS